MIKIKRSYFETFQLLNSFFSNRITRDGAKHLAEFLKKDTALKSLDLGYNRLEDDGAKHIAEAIMLSNTNLLK